jgi:hypothetical protein
MTLGVDDIYGAGRVYPDGSAGKPVLTVSSETLAVPFWSDSPDAWDTVVIAGRSLPGICKMKGKIVRRVDRKNSTGTNGATITYVGDDVAEFEVTVRMWNDTHLASYAALIAFLRDRQSPDDANGLGATIASGASSKLVVKLNEKRGYSKFPMAPVAVEHPTLTLYRVRAAHILEYSFPEPVGEAAAGIYEANIKCIEHIALNKGQVTTPRGAIDLVKRFGDGALPKAIAKPSVNNAANPKAAADVVAK